jgi:hypothetical protein
VLKVEHLKNTLKAMQKRAKRGATLTPNLFFSGQMLGNMSFKKLSHTKGQIFFPNRTQNIKAFFNDQSRPFFDVNQIRRR